MKIVKGVLFPITGKEADLFYKRLLEIKRTQHDRNIEVQKQIVKDYIRLKKEGLFDK